MSNNITQTTIKEMLDYNPSNGLFTWKMKRTGKAKVGTIAGYFDTCALHVHFKGNSCHG